MRMFAMMVFGIAMQGAAFAQAPAQPGEVLAGLTGSCWRTQLDNAGPDTDTHCFEVADSGKMVTDTHKVRNPAGKAVYEGVSVYLLDKPSGTLVYEYFYSNGCKLVGYGWRTGEEIQFASKSGAKSRTWYGSSARTATPSRRRRPTWGIRAHS